jgi:hypothetical protein
MAVTMLLFSTKIAIVKFINLSDNELSAIDGELHSETAIWYRSCFSYNPFPLNHSYLDVLGTFIEYIQ